MSLIKEYQPHIVGLTATEPTYLLGKSLIELIANRKDILKIVGGAHVTINPELVINENTIVVNDEQEGNGDGNWNPSENVSISFEIYNNSAENISDLNLVVTTLSEYINIERGDQPSTGKVDVPHNELTRIRTRTGHQLLFHNSEDLIYIGNANGTSWVELSSDGKVDVFAEDSISFHTKNDFNRAFRQ